MMRITALPIKGESYLLEHLGKLVLVDGGYASSKLVSALKQQLGTDTPNLDVVVCTHSDSDHAGGLVDLLYQKGVTIAELWLPGSWSDIITDLVSFTELFYKEFIDEVTSYDDEHLNALSSEDIQVIDRELARLTSKMHYPEITEDSIKSSKLDLRPRDSVHKSSAAARAKRAITKWGRCHQVNRKAFELIDTSERIRKIALSAFINNVPVRWFDYLAYSKLRATSGGEAFLRPINARQFAKMPSSLNCLKLSRFVALSRANRESLVFLSSGNNTHVDVLFCGDLPLGDGPCYKNSFLSGKQSTRPLIATAPHHGSDSNSMAYQHIMKFGNVAFWIRAGGNSQHPGYTFRRIPTRLRTCTSCPHVKHPLQSVTITDDPRTWLTVRSHDCKCS